VKKDVRENARGEDSLVYQGELVGAEEAAGGRV